MITLVSQLGPLTGKYIFVNVTQNKELPKHVKFLLNAILVGVPPPTPPFLNHSLLFLLQSDIHLTADW